VVKIYQAEVEFGADIPNVFDNTEGMIAVFDFPMERTVIMHTGGICSHCIEKIRGNIEMYWEDVNDEES